MERPAYGRYWRNVQASAAARGYEVTVSMDEAFAILERQGFACALTGETIKIADSVKGHLGGETTASLDRIDSSKGYVPGNLQWLHKDVNRLKSTLGQDRFIQICMIVAQRHGTHEQAKT